MYEKNDELVEIVGEENVLGDPAALDVYARDNSFALPRKPRFVVKPENTDEVQEIVKWANRTGTILVPVSSGPPRFRGDTVPGAEGSVVVDLSRMKRILSIDRRNRIAVFEPGVTYGELQKVLAGEGLRLSTPLLPRRSKSVVTSLLEREPILTPKYQWTLMEPLRCLEVIWGNGSSMWTGEAGEYSSHDIEEQKKKFRAFVVGMGPGSVDFYRLISAAQGTIGIATWASVKCDVLPAVHKFFFIAGETLESLLDCAYKTLRIRFGDEFLLLNSANLASILGKGTGQISALKKELPSWMIILGIAGRDFLPQERIEYQTKDIAAVAEQSGLKMVTEVPGAEAGEVTAALLNPSKEPYWKLGYKGGSQDIFFLTTLDKTPEFVKTIYSVAEEMKYLAADIGVYIQPLQQGVSCHCEFTFSYDPGNPEETAKARELFDKASKALLKQGAFFSRPYGSWAGMVYQKDAEAAVLLKKVKGMFDPNNVLNPGKLCF